MVFYVEALLAHAVDVDRAGPIQIQARDRELDFLRVLRGGPEVGFP